MAVILATTLRVGSVDKNGKGSTKVVEEGTPYEKLTKAEKELAKELGLLRQVADPEPDLEEEIEEAEETEAENSEAESE